MLREDKSARVERVAVPAPRLSWGERLADWINHAPPRPDWEIMYEFSVGKYNPLTQEQSTTWEFARIPAIEFAQLAEAQKVRPVVLMRNATGKRWWWYLGRFYREAEGLQAAEVHERVLQLRRDEEERVRRVRAEGGTAQAHAEASVRAS